MDFHENLAIVRQNSTYLAKNDIPSACYPFFLFSILNFQSQKKEKDQAITDFLKSSFKFSFCNGRDRTSTRMCMCMCKPLFPN